MRARDRMRQEADRRLQQEAVAEALGERRRGYSAPLFIRDEMANGWRANAVYVRPDPDPAPALPAELWDKLIGPPLVDVGPAPEEVHLPYVQHPCPECGGSGYGDSWDGVAYWTCPACSGTGSAEPPLFDMEPPTTGETND